ncbi:hypothetical protein N7527_011759 [Penicillium freii]|nr:hypothetical protein N7527_011759 [Penicillium freii]
MGESNFASWSPMHLDVRHFEDPCRQVLQNIADLSFLATATPVNHIDPPYNSPICPIWGVGQSVRTTSGFVVGHSAANAPGVSESVEIPYAAPPLGRLRFQSPVRYTGSDTISAPHCAPTQNLGIPSTFAAAFASEVYPASEDCLTLNVWAKPQTGEAKKAVLVWVYGGGYVSDVSQAVLDRRHTVGNPLLTKATFSYRANTFGIPGNPVTPANIGLRGLQVSLEWIRNNIEQFGGDPERITIFGQSTGAGMVDFYSFAYADDPIASGFIEMGAIITVSQPLLQKRPTIAGSHVTNLVGCGNATSDPVAVSDFIDDELVFSSYLNRTAAKGGYPSQSLSIVSHR